MRFVILFFFLFMGSLCGGEEVNISLSASDYHWNRLNHFIYGTDFSIIEGGRAPASQADLRQDVRNCFSSFCFEKTIPEEDIEKMNLSTVVSGKEPGALAFIEDKIDIVVQQVQECNRNVETLIFEKVGGSSGQIVAQYLREYRSILNRWGEGCKGRLREMDVNQKYIVDRSFIDATREKVLKMYGDIFSDGVMERLRQKTVDMKGLCYYQNYDNDILAYKIRSQCSKLSKGIDEIQRGPNYRDSLISFFEEIKGVFLQLDQNCQSFRSVDYATFPINSTYPSPGDYNSDGDVLFSNQTCWNKELGEGIVAHEFAHAYSTIFSKLEDRDVVSLRNYRRVRKCLNDAYSVRRPPQPMLERDPVDELNTEEDFADLFKFKITRSRYPYACEIMDYAIASISRLERRELLGVYDFIDFSNPHSTPIIRLLHEAKVRQLSLPPQCQQAQKSASGVFNARHCWPLR